MSLATARTRNAPLLGSRCFKLQQFGQCRGACLMHGRTHRHLDRFQIEMVRLLTSVENDTQQLAYFVRDFLLDRFGRFFSCGESESSTGRARQIFSFTSSNT